MNVRAFLMLVSGGLFAGGVTALAWDRIPAWRSMPLTEFGTDFAGVVHRADRVQPGLLVVAIVASFAFGLTELGAARILALIGASGFLATLFGSVAVLVPLQRRMISSSSPQAGPSNGCATGGSGVTWGGPWSAWHRSCWWPGRPRCDVARGRRRRQRRARPMGEEGQRRYLVLAMGDAYRTRPRDGAPQLVPSAAIRLPLRGAVHTTRDLRAEATDRRRP